MITLLKKIRKSLLNSVGFKKYVFYALGEILLVMIGILLALQVNNWNENRKLRKKEHTLLTQLHDEFLENKKQLKTVSQMHQRGLDYCIKMINLFPIDPQNVDLDSIYSFLYHNAILSEWTFTPSNATVSALSSNGSFDIISDPVLRNKMMMWNSALNDYLEDQSIAMWYLNNELNPYIGKRVSNGPMGMKDIRLNLDFLKTPEFENMIYGRAHHFKTLLSKEPYYPEHKNLVNMINDIVELTEQT